MIDVAKHWNPKQAQLKTLVRNPERFGEAIELCLDMHSLVHTGEMSQAGFKTFEDFIWDGLEEAVFRILPKEEEASIAWHLWHLTRIEDITANVLVAGEVQVMDTGNWAGKLLVDTHDTGNAMTPYEIEAFSLKIPMEALRDYRIAVGRKTRTVIKSLKQGDLKKRWAQNACSAYLTRVESWKAPEIYWTSGEEKTLPAYCSCP